MTKSKVIKKLENFYELNKKLSQFLRKLFFYQLAWFYCS